MRRFLIFLIIAGLGGLYLYQKHGEPASAAKPVAAQSIAAKSTPAPLTPALRGEASEHNWMKRSLDRARDVSEKSRAQTTQSQDP